MSRVRIDNSYLADKAMLRLRHLPDTDPVVVLDAFGGSGKVWQCVQANTERKIIRLAIDEKNIPGTLKGDNRKFLPTLDLTKFHVIDLDAYSVPYEQLEIIFKRQIAWHGQVVFVTWIGLNLGIMPDNVLRDYGYTKNMIKSVKTLLTIHKYKNIIMAYLNRKGVDEIWLKSSPEGNKHYFGFQLSKGGDYGAGHL
jgi:hypothetical protein